MNLIFAVTEEQFSVYNLLKENIEGSSAGTLTNDSSNIVQLVKEQYQVTDQFILKRIDFFQQRLELLHDCKLHFL